MPGRCRKEGAIRDAYRLYHTSPQTAQALDQRFRFQRPAGDGFTEDDRIPRWNPVRDQVAKVAARAVTNAPGWSAERARH